MTTSSSARSLCSQHRAHRLLDVALAFVGGHDDADARCCCGHDYLRSRLTIACSGLPRWKVSDELISVMIARASRSCFCSSRISPVSVRMRAHVAVEPGQLGDNAAWVGHCARSACGWRRTSRATAATPARARAGRRRAAVRARRRRRQLIDGSSPSHTKSTPSSSGTSAEIALALLVERLARIPLPHAIAAGAEERHAVDAQIAGARGRIEPQRLQLRRRNRQRQALATEADPTVHRRHVLGVERMIAAIIKLRHVAERRHVGLRDHGRARLVAGERGLDDELIEVSASGSPKSVRDSAGGRLSSRSS